MVSLLTALMITGASGQLGDALARAARLRGIDHVAVSRPEFDFDRPETLAACLDAVNPWAVINAAAYTAVDAAEGDPEAAERANFTGPKLLAHLCSVKEIPLIHVSTDYVFDGSKGAAYLEQDATNPCGIYGATKRAGEVALLASGAKAIILRTAWLYAAHGKNFVSTMLHAARKNARLRVVGDQKGAPTAAIDLASAILDIVEILRTGWREEYRGIFHATCTGETSWHGFAAAIFAAAAPLGLKPPQLDAITTAEWPAPVKRPADSRLDCTKLANIFGCRLPHWQQRLPITVEQLLPAVLLRDQYGF